MTKMEQRKAAQAKQIEALNGYKKALAYLTTILPGFSPEFLVKNSAAIKAVSVDSKEIGKMLNKASKAKLPGKRGRPAMTAKEKAEAMSRRAAKARKASAAKVPKKTAKAVKKTVKAKKPVQKGTVAKAPEAHAAPKPILIKKPSPVMSVNPQTSGNSGSGTPTPSTDQK